MHHIVACTLAALAITTSQAEALGTSWFGANRGATVTKNGVWSAANWGNWANWGAKPASASLWGSCPQGKWQWRTGCRAIPECAPGQAWKGWAAGCCKNECPRNQTWDPRTGLCCAVPTCPTNQGWKGWARGCGADNTKTNDVEYARPATVPTLVAPVPEEDVDIITGENIDLIGNENLPDVVSVAPLPVLTATTPTAPLPVPEEEVDAEFVDGESVDDSEDLSGELRASEDSDIEIIEDGTDPTALGPVTPIVPLPISSGTPEMVAPEVAPLPVSSGTPEVVAPEVNGPEDIIDGADPISRGPEMPAEPAPIPSQAEPIAELPTVEEEMGVDGEGEDLPVDGEGEGEIYDGEGADAM